MDNKEVGRFISDCRKEKNLTQKQLAEMLGVTNKAVSKWETGEGYPDITLLPKLSDALNVSIDELLLGKKEKQIEVAVEKVEKKDNKKIILWSSIAMLLIATAFYFIGHYYGFIQNPSVIFSVFIIGAAIEIFICIKLSM